MRQRVWLLTLALLVASAALWLGYVRMLPVFASPHIAWWLLAILFFASEQWAMNAKPQYRALALEVSAAPFVIALFYASPAEMLAAYVLGALAAIATRFPAGVAFRNSTLRVARSAAEEAFEVAAFVALATTGEAMFHVLAGSSGALSWQTWIAAGASGVLLAGRTAVAPLLTSGSARVQWLDAARDVSRVTVGTAACASLGVIAAVLIKVYLPAVFLVVLPGIALVAVHRSLGRERQQRIVAEFLQGAGSALGSRELETAIVSLLHQARSMFNADIAQLTIFPAIAGEKAFRTTVRSGDPDQVMEPLDLTQLDDVLEAETDGMIVDRGKSSVATRQMLERRGIDEALVALLRGESRLLGSLLVGGHLNDRAFDAKDLRLFQTLVIQTASTLENGRLERTVARLTELQAQLTHQAFHDPLTDLANRALFRDRVEHALQRSARSGLTAAILFLDIDDFKAVNDTLGHAAGDELLVGVSQRLRACLRTPDTAARLGGDEFSVLLEDLEGPAEAELVARRMIEAMRRPFELSGNTARARISIGIAVADRGGDNANTLMRRADVAMYAAKGAGKDRYLLFAQGMESAVVGRHQLRSDLERGLAAEEFVLHYQPIVDMASGQLAGMEALVRWRHPTRGLIGPAEFIPLAEESGLILTLGHHVLRAACSNALRLQARYPTATPLMVTVNVSARQLQQPLFVESVLALVHEIGLLPQTLVLELTESILLDDATASIVKLEALQRAGIRIAIDDFGTGYSSLSYLRRLPVDILKIAKPFVDDLAVPDATGEFVQAIVGIATALRLTVIAEGIESPTQVTRLLELGCTLGQGYHLCHPVVIDEIEVLLRSGGVEPARLGDDDAARDLIIPLRTAR